MRSKRASNARPNTLREGFVRRNAGKTNPPAGEEADATMSVVTVNCSRGPMLSGLKSVETARRQLESGRTGPSVSLSGDSIVYYPMPKGFST
jgi:hypothetical protein